MGGATCDQHQEPAASPALFTLASRRALGSAPISEAARVTQVPTAISSSSSRRLDFPSLGAASFVASPRCCWSSFSQARPPIRYGAPTLPPRAAAPPFWIGLAWGSRSQVFIEFYDIVYGILSLSEISASVRGSCPCAHSAVLLSFVLPPLVPDELGVAALRPSLGGGHSA